MDLPSKRIVLEFVGGDADGRVIDSDSATPPERDLIMSVFYLSDGGKVGRWWYGASITQMEQMGRRPVHTLPKSQPGLFHSYAVVDRQESETELHILLKYSVRDLPESRGQG
jgi:hypothetical protein